jgi:hypothetical protein
LLGVLVLPAWLVPGPTLPCLGGNWRGREAGCHNHGKGELGFVHAQNSLELN